jgi:hypothetical protein
LKDKLLTRVEFSGNPRAQLYKLFIDIDDNGRNKLRFDNLFVLNFQYIQVLFYSRVEFEFFMNSVNINFSRKKWNQIYREIDLNNDDTVNLYANNFIYAEI